MIDHVFTKYYNECSKRRFIFLTIRSCLRFLLVPPLHQLHFLLHLLWLIQMKEVWLKTHYQGQIYHLCLQHSYLKLMESRKMFLPAPSYEITRVVEDIFWVSERMLVSLNRIQSRTREYDQVIDKLFYIRSRKIS